MDEKFTPNGEELNNMPVGNNPAKEFMYFLYDLLKTGIVVFVIAFCIRYFLIQPFVVEGSSMLPNYEDREYLLAEKLSYHLGNPKRGDVVIFKYPKNPTVNYIKRVIGIPGDTVTIKNNKITITNDKNPSGVTISESYIPSNVQTLTSEKTELKVKVEDGNYFVLGDNREHSSDSREWGLLPKTNIIGRAWLTIRPLDKFGVQKRLTYPEVSVLLDLAKYFV